MKVKKSEYASIFFKPLVLKGKLYAIYSVIVGFELLAPENLLKESKTWEIINSQIKQPVIFDPGFPKARGEVLLSGKAFSSQPVKALEVRLIFDQLDKTLVVFGDRHWQKKGLSISEPASFTSLPLTWDRAFGGKNFGNNPYGKGLDYMEKNQQQVLPLPNVEYPEQLLTSPKQKPEPASFLPLPLTHQARISCQGTYNQEWLNNNWPYFPHDLSLEFFNQAPLDQRLESFITGKENVRIFNMHPQKEQINSRLPQIRPRLFVTQQQNANEETFAEVELKIDTFWIFPELLTGVIIFRGFSKIKDEEFDDIKYIYLELEKQNEPKKSKDEYLKKQKEFFFPDKKIKEKYTKSINKKITLALKKINLLPKKIKNILNNTSDIETNSTLPPKELSNLHSILMNHQISNLEKIQQAMLNTQKKWGIELPISKVDILKQKIADQQFIVNKKETTLTFSTKKLKKNQEKILKTLTPKDKKVLEDLKINLESTSKLSSWEKQAWKLIKKSKITLKKHNDLKNKLKKAGFFLTTINRYFLGYNSKEQLLELSKWNIDKPDHFTLFPGLIIPAFSFDKLVRVSLRPKDYTINEEILLPGSQLEALYLESFNSSADVTKLIVRASGDLEAYFLEQEIGDLASILALKQPEQKLPQNIEKKHLNNNNFIILLFNEEDKEVWLQHYPKAKIISVDYQNIFELYKQKDIRKIILESIKIKNKESKKIDLKNKTVVLPEIINLQKNTIKNIKEQIKLEIKNIKSNLAQKEENHIKNEEEEVSKKILNTLSNQKEDKNIRDSLRTLISDLKNTNTYTKNINEDTKQFYKETENTLNKLLTTIENLNNKKEKIDKPLNNSIQKKIKQSKRISKEEVIYILETSKEFSGLNISNLDLSDLDFSNSNFKKCNLNNIIFNNSILEECTFTKSILTKVKFKNSTLNKSQFENSYLKQSIIENSHLENITIKKCALLEVEIKNSKLISAELYLSNFQNCQFANSNFNKTKTRLFSLSNTDISNCSFENSKIRKTLFNKGLLKEVSFNNSHLEDIQFIYIKYNIANFNNSKLHKFRASKNCDFSYSNFIDTQIIYSCFRESKLLGSNFKNSNQYLNVFEKCDLQESKFQNSNMPETKFHKCNLKNANLNKVNLLNGSLRKSELIYTDLSNSNLFGVNFYKAIFNKVNLNGSNLKRTFLQDKLYLLNKNEIL